MSDNPRDERQPTNVTPFFAMALLALVAHLASTGLHESLHFFVGRFVGLPAHFLSLTSVGVSPSVAATAAPSSVALMNGIAPLATMLLGLLALAAVPALRPKAPAAVTDFVAWWAIFGVPYIGLQLMTAALPINVRGNGADSAAVLGGYFGISLMPRVAISLVGLLIYMASGFWLGAAVSQRTASALSRPTLRQRLRGLAPWRLVGASLLGFLLIGMTARYVVLWAHGSFHGVLLFFRLPYVWAALMALLVSWRAPGARYVRDRWIFPGLLVGALLIAVGWLDNDDLVLEGSILVVPLIATAWIQSSSHEPV